MAGKKVPRIVFAGLTFDPSLLRLNIKLDVDVSSDFSGQIRSVIEEMPQEILLSALLRCVVLTGHYGTIDHEIVETIDYDHSAIVAQRREAKRLSDLERQAQKQKEREDYRNMR